MAHISSRRRRRSRPVASIASALLWVAVAAACDTDGGDAQTATQPAVSVADSDGERWISTSASSSTTRPTTTSSTTTTPTTTTSTTTTTTTLAPTTPPAPTTTAPEPAGPAIAELPQFVTAPIAAASPDGVDVRFADGTTLRVIDEPTAVALLVGDDVIFQREAPWSGENSDTAVFRWRRATDTVEELTLTNPTGGPVGLFDVAAVDGSPTLLYETGPTECDAGIDCDSALVTLDLDTGDGIEIDRMNTFEAAWLGLTLADNGWIVGTVFASITSSMYTNTIGADPALEPTEVGLEDSYSDCEFCPRAYSIDPAATAVSWIVRLDDGTPAMVKSALGGIPFRVEFAEGPDSVCSLDAGSAVGDDDGPASGFFLATACPGPETAASVAVDVTDDFVGDAIALAAGVRYDLGR